MKNLENSAATIFDGGWRCRDIEELKTEHGLTEDESEELAEELKKIEVDTLLTEIPFNGYDPCNQIIAFTDGEYIYAASQDDWNGEYYSGVESTGEVGEWQEFSGNKVQDIEPVYDWQDEPEIIGYKFR